MNLAKTKNTERTGSNYKFSYCKRMKIYVILIYVLFASCSDDDANESQVIIVSNVNGRGSLSIFDYSSGNLSDPFFTVNSPFSEPVIGALKRDNFVFMHTGYNQSTLRKIDLSSGVETKQVRTWIYSTTRIDTQGSDIILNSIAFENGSYFLQMKIYDQNLVLKDSIMQEGVRQLHATSVSNGRLFRYIVIEDLGGFIQVLDLNTKAIVDSIELPFIGQFVSLDENRLMVIGNGGYQIMNTQSLTISSLITPFCSAEDPVYYSLRDNILYALCSNAQPSASRYSLYKVDPLTGDYTILSHPRELISGPTTFDSKSNRIITGGLKIFSTNGAVIKDFGLGNGALYYFVK
jgi:hypothetical protein